jgi:hypothetical protein
MINMFSLLIYLIHLIRGLFLFSLLIYVIHLIHGLFLFSLLIITIFYLQIYEFAYCLFDIMIHITTMAYVYVHWLLQGTTLINTWWSQVEAGQLLAFEPLLQTHLWIRVWIQTQEFVIKYVINNNW